MGFLKLLTTKRGRSLFLPAHGRGAALPSEMRNLLRNRAGIWDLPELEDLGSPLDSQGAIARSQEEAAEAAGVLRAWYGVNGATGLLQAALLGICKPGQVVLMPRNIHCSLINACVLGNLNPILFDLPYKTDRGHYIPPDYDWLENLLDELDRLSIDCSIIVLVHPTYQGYANNLEPLIELLHKRNFLVLVDEAHGAHFASNVDSKLPSSALKAGADLVVHSLHKSALGLVQTAVLWLQGNQVDPYLIERSMRLLMTTSPSSLLLASCESSLREWRTDSGKQKLKSRLDEARFLFEDLKNAGVPLIKSQDPLRLIFHTSKIGINGLEADSWFISKGLIAELPEPGCLTFCLGFASQKGLLDLLKRRWTEFLDTQSSSLGLNPFPIPPYPLVSVLSMNCSSAFQRQSEEVLISNAIGKVSAEFICPYPPGIPLVLPGEYLDDIKIEWLLRQRQLWLKHIDKKIRVVSI